MSLQSLARMSSLPGKFRQPRFTTTELNSMLYSKEACRTHWQTMTDMKPRETYIINIARRKKQREQLENACKRHQQNQAQLTSVAPTISQVVRPESPSILPAILDACSWSPVFPTTDYITVASSNQITEPPDVHSPPSLNWEGTTPADSVISVLTPQSQEIKRPSSMSSEVPKPHTSRVNPEAGAHYSSHSTHATSIKRPTPSEFNESINESWVRVAHRPPTPSVAEEHAWTQQNSNSPVVQDCENRRDAPTPSRPLIQEGTLHEPGNVSTASLQVVQDDTEPESGNTATHPMTVAEVEDEMKAPRGFISFIRYGLTKSRLSVQSMLSASGTIRSRFSSRRSSRYSTMATELPGDANPFLYEGYMSSRDQSISAIQPLQPVKYGGGRQETNLFLELRLAGTTDDHVAGRLKNLLRDIDPAKARAIANMRNESGETALEVALALGNVPACKALLDAGADVRARASNGKSLSKFGRIAQSEAHNNAHYIAIGSCRNVILSHVEPQKGNKSQKASNAKTNTTPRRRVQIATNSRLAQVLQDQSHITAGESLLSASAQQEGPSGPSQETASTVVLNDTTQPRLVLGDMALAENNSTSGSNLVSMPTPTLAKDVPAPRPIPSQPNLTPGVPDLIAFFESGGPADPTGSQHQALDPSPMHTNQSLCPGIQLWNSYLPPSSDLVLPSSTSLEGGSGTLDTPSIPGSTENGHYEVLPDGRVVWVFPFNLSLPRASPPLSRHFSHRNARVLGMGNSLQLQVPITTQINFSQPIMQDSLYRQPVHGSYNPYASNSNIVAYSTSVQQQEQYFQNMDFAGNNGLSNPPPTSNLYNFTPSHLPNPTTAYSNNDSTFQWNNHISNSPNQDIGLSTMELEALMFHSSSDNASHHGNNFVHGWDSLPTGL